MSVIRVEVVYALPDRQFLTELDVAAGTRISEAIDASGVRTRFPREDLDGCDVGIWGRIVPPDTVLEQGDRVEIYRPLKRDPREARRERARTA